MALIILSREPFTLIPTALKKIRSAVRGSELGFRVFRCKGRQGEINRVRFTLSFAQDKEAVAAILGTNAK